MRLAAGLRPDSRAGELERYPRPPSRNRGRVLLLRGRKWRAGEKGGGERLPRLYLIAGYGPVTIFGTLSVR